MNAERLHLVAQAVAGELASMNLVELVGQLRNGLQALSSNPADSGAQQQVSSFRTQLTTALDNAPSNDWAPTDRQILDELGISDVLGAKLLERIEDILGRNEITPSVAFGEAAPIHDRLSEVANSISQLLAGLDFFGISMDDLVDEYEVGVAIPRRAVHDGLRELGEEFVALHRMLQPFQELAREGRPDFEVRSIASTEFGVFLAAIPGVAYLIAKAVKEVVETYEKILNIRRIRAEMAGLVPETTLSDVDEYANKVMDERITELVEEILTASALDDENRKNELRTEVRRSLNGLANRIDSGYSVDIRTPPPPEPSETAEEEEESPEQARVTEIQELAARIKRLELSGSRILQLPEGDGDSESDTTESPPS